MWDLRTFAQFQESKITSWFFQDLMDGYRAYYDLAQWQLKIVETIGSQYGRPQFDSPWWPILDSRFIVFMSVAVGA